MTVALYAVVFVDVSVGTWPGGRRPTVLGRHALRQLADPGSEPAFSKRHGHPGDVYNLNISNLVPQDGMHSLANILKTNSTQVTSLKLQR